MTSSAIPAPPDPPGSYGLDTDAEGARSEALAVLRAALSSGAAGAQPAQLSARALETLPEGLHPLIAYAAARAGWLLPVQVGNSLRAARRRGAAARLKRAVAFRQAIAALGRLGAPVLVLKGQAAAFLGYPEPGLRLMGDIDLWVAPGLLDSALDTLGKAGFAVTARLRDGMPVRPAGEAQACQSLEHATTGTIMELHALPASLGGLDAERRQRIWQRAQSLKVEGTTVQVPHPEDFLLHTALHAGLQNRFTGRLVSLVDTHYLLGHASRQLDWPEMERDWDRTGLGDWIRLHLWLCGELLGSAVPPEVTRSLQKRPQARAMLDLAIGQLWCPADFPTALDWMAGHATLDRHRWLYGRLIGHYWGDPHARAGQRIREATRRLLFDVRVRLPRYFARWRRGELRPDRLRARAALVRDRERLAAMVGNARPGST